MSLVRLYHYFFFSLYYLQHLTFLLQSEVCLTYSKADPFFLNYEKKNQKNEISLPPPFPSISDIIDISLLFSV